MLTIKMQPSYCKKTQEGCVDKKVPNLDKRAEKVKAETFTNNVKRQTSFVVLQRAVTIVATLMALATMAPVAALTMRQACTMVYRRVPMPATVHLRRK